MNTETAEVGGRELHTSQVKGSCPSRAAGALQHSMRGSPYDGVMSRQEDGGPECEALGTPVGCLLVHILNTLGEYICTKNFLKQNFLSVDSHNIFPDV